MPRRGTWAALIWAYVLVYMAGLVAAYVHTGFHVGHNDFWGNLYQAEHLDFANAQTLYDGFFPIGYPLYLRYGPFDDAVGAAFSLNAGAAVLLLGVAGVFALMFLPGPWALGAVIALSFLPRVFGYALAPTSDLPMTLLAFAAGAALVYGTVRVSQSTRRRVLAWIVAGALFGLAALVRQHGLVLAGGFMLAAAIVRRSLWPLLIPAVVCALVYLPQIVINLQSGHGPFETYQHINIYKVMHGVRLYDVPESIPASPVAVIAEAPWTFASRWLGHFARMAALLLPAAVLALAALQPAVRKLGAMILVAGLPYAAAVALAWSDRAPLPLLPWTALTTACLFRAIYERLRLRGGRGGEDARLFLVTAGIGVALLLAVFVRRDMERVQAYARQHARYDSIERALRSDGVVHPKQVFTTDPSLYLPNTPPHHAYFNGGWLRFSLYEYAERYPNLDVSSVAALADDARREGVTHLALTPAAADRSFALGHLYRNPEAHPSKFFYLGHVDAYRLYRRREPAPPEFLVP